MTQSHLPQRFEWSLSPPLIEPKQRPNDVCISVKDPSLVRHEGRWHLFCTLRSRRRSHQIEYVTFDDWDRTAHAERRLLSCREGYFCAPQVFYFRPHERWVLIYQVTEPGRTLGLQPAYSTTRDIADPDSWTPAALLFPEGDPSGVERWIDFWVICDAEHAHLFFTSLDGRLWKMSAPVSDFPRGFSNVRCVRRDVHDGWRLFEASHTYALKGGGYLTVVEAENKRRNNERFYLAYVADGLDDEWRPLAASPDHPFASRDNLRTTGEPWTEYVSHGELLRDGSDETLTVDPSDLRFLIQGVRAADTRGRSYGEIPWRLGLLTAAQGPR